jgi:hypothetical protein
MWWWWWCVCVSQCAGQDRLLHGSIVAMDAYALPCPVQTCSTCQSCEKMQSDTP